jgi:hypothetical protein
MTVRELIAALQATGRPEWEVEMFARVDRAHGVKFAAHDIRIDVEKNVERMVVQVMVRHP